MAAIWSEVGRLEREGGEGPVEKDWKAIGTGLVVEQKTVLETNEVGEASQVWKTQLAMGMGEELGANKGRWRGLGRAWRGRVSWRRGDRDGRVPPLTFREFLTL